MLVTKFKLTLIRVLQNETKVEKITCDHTFRTRLNAPNFCYFQNNQFLILKNANNCKFSQI